MNKIAIFSLVIAISVAILSVFQFNKYQKFTVTAQMNLKKLSDEINLKLEGSDKDIATLKEQEYAILTRIQDPVWKNIQTNLKTLENEINLKIEGFNKDISTLKEQELSVLTQIQNPNWKMAEVEYLLYLATARLEGTPNVKAAITLLTTAEEKVTALNDPNLMPLSQALEKDLNALQSISPPNTEELWLKMGTLIGQASTLSPRGIGFSEEKKETTPIPNTTGNATSWKQTFLNSFKEMSDLIKIRHYSKPVEPLLSETQQTMATMNLRLLLEQVRFAILASDQTIYQHSIQSTEQLLTAYYNDADPNVKNLQNALTELNQINLRPALPKMTSLEFFNKVR